MKTISQFLILILLSLPILWFISVSKVFSPEDTSQMIECSVFKDDNGTLSLIDVADYLPTSVSVWFSFDQLTSYVQWNVAAEKVIVGTSQLILLFSIFIIVKFINIKYPILSKDTKYGYFYNIVIRGAMAGFVVIIISSVLQMACLYYFTDLPNMLETLRIAKAKLVLTTPFHFVEI